MDFKLSQFACLFMPHIHSNFRVEIQSRTKVMVKYPNLTIIFFKDLRLTVREVDIFRRYVSVEMNSFA